MSEVSEATVDLEAWIDDPHLRAVSVRYCWGLDRRDRALFTSAFMPDAAIEIRMPDAPATRYRGHEQIGDLTGRIARFGRTFHHLHQGLYSLSEAVASGEVYLTAHHFSSALAGEGTNLVMYIRYVDEYAQDPRGRWRISNRIVNVDATELRSVS